jgi:glycosyltransferase involved in cell wall biosynthesis
MKFSLIIATFGKHKVALIERLLISLVNQSYQEFEILIIDQNADPELIQSLLVSFKDKISIKYFHTEIKSLSLARNIGLENANGDIIAFPDDDCSYPNHLIENVADFFHQNPGFALLSASCRDIDTGQILSFVSMNHSGKFSYKEVFTAISSISFFIRISKDFDLRFDDRFGIGGIFNSSEEFDFVTRFLVKAGSGYFKKELYVSHPNNFELNPHDLYCKVKKNSIGHGAYLSKHKSKMKIKVLEILIIRPVVGMLYYLITFNKKKFKISYFSLVYRIKGFFLFKP